ncbi:glycosyl hydrolase 2 galactose-binding domain-containing protein [Candidatus Lokiarchaeum ossiferum]|uniref:glycosyl hydrolase 2 galactose-binding domain-containing protein n=1 Tax=Candidatus Lokiarchaeum ossiferum TaxID=2951803 RepID=UPI00352C20B8
MNSVSSTNLLSLQNLSLNKGWTIQNSSIKPIHIDVPCTVLEVLEERKIISDPFYGNNEGHISWVFEEDWIFIKKFFISNEILLFEQIELIFHGLDTITTIYLNDKEVSSTKNMFRKYEFDIKNYIHEGLNELKVQFHSPTKYVAKKIEKEHIKLNTGYAGIPGVPYLRKSQYSFGWDWGPKFPDIGIWQPVEIISWNKVKINSVNIKQKLNFSKHKVHWKKSISSIQPVVDSAEVCIDLELDGKIPLKNMADVDIETSILLDSQIISKFSQKLETSSSSQQLIIQNPKLWWIIGLGDQILYTLQVIIRSHSSSLVLDERQLKFGIRELQLIRQPDQWGESFYFSLNRVPIFAKGANWIPIDSCIPRGKKMGLYEMNLHAAIDANMNFLRVWGGGIYEDDLFYDLCDQLGILVWQDFPFACAIYPYNDEFLKNVEVEVIQNIKRIRNHPSLALWCGNNEIEQLWPLLAFESRLLGKKVHRKFKVGYHKLFEQKLPFLTERFDPSRSYWPSSPSNGFSEGKKFKGSLLNLLKSNQAHTGDSHFWKVWHQSAPFSAFRKFNSRFMSEYGFESFPSLKTIKSFCPDSELDFFSSIMENHQKNSAGNAKILKYMKRRFKIPSSFESQVILSQITHGEALEYGIEHWRRHRTNFECMGSLYWQLNDCWPVASWSSVDYYGRWKASHYFVKRSYSPLLISIQESDSKVEIWGTNDLQYPVQSSVKWSIQNHLGVIKYQNSVEVNLVPCCSILIDKITLKQLSISRRELKNHVIFYSTQFNGIESLRDRAFGFRLFKEPKSFPLQNPGINFDLFPINSEEKKIQDRFSFQIKISAKKIAVYVHFKVQDCDFIVSDNYFSLHPNEDRVITMKILLNKQGITKNLEELQKKISIESLFSLTR